VDVPNVRLDGTVKAISTHLGALSSVLRPGGRKPALRVIEMTLGAQIMGKLTQVTPVVATEGSASGGASGD